MIRIANYRHRQQQVEDTSIGMYLKNLNETPLLTKEEEKSLSRRIQSTPKESSEHKQAVEHLVKANLRFGVKIASEYQIKGYEFLDLIGYATEGLYEAAERFDYKKATKFSSYSVWWIRQKIRKKVTDDKLIRLPGNRNQVLNHIYDIWNEYFPESHDPPHYNKIKQFLRISEDRYKSILKTIVIISLQTPLLEETADTTLQDTIISEDYEVPETKCEQNDLQQKISIILSKLPTKEQDIIKDRFGLEGRTQQSLASIGNKYNLTKERIRQIEMLALKNLRRDSDTKQLYELLA